MFLVCSWSLAKGIYKYIHITSWNLNFFRDEAQSHLRSEEQEAKLSIGEEHNEKHHSETANVLAALSNQPANINNHID